MAGLGRWLGSAITSASMRPEKVPYAIDRFTQEVERLFGVMDKRLSDRPYLAGAYSIADIASFPLGAELEDAGSGHH